MVSLDILAALISFVETWRGAHPNGGTPGGTSSAAGGTPSLPFNGGTPSLLCGTPGGTPSAAGGDAVVTVQRRDAVVTVQRRDAGRHTPRLDSCHAMDCFPLAAHSAVAAPR